MGPWNHGYGMRQDYFRVEIQVFVGEEGLLFISVPKPSNNLPAASTILIQELLDDELPPHTLPDSAVVVDSAVVDSQPLMSGQVFSVAVPTI